MKREELRIGNYVLHYCKEYEVAVIDMCEGTHLFKPIPLTEEWLVEFGFEYRTELIIDGRCVVIYNMPFNYEFQNFEHIDGKPTFEVCPSRNKSYQIGINSRYVNTVHYVHQLQNLYFALTGEELKTK